MGVDAGVAVRGHGGVDWGEGWMQWGRRQRKRDIRFDDLIKKTNNVTNRHLD